MTKDLINEIVPKEKDFELRKDNPQYSLGQTNGWYLCREQILKNLEKLNLVRMEEVVKDIKKLMVFNPHENNFDKIALASHHNKVLTYVIERLSQLKENKE